MTDSQRNFRKGVLSALVAYGLWGLMPLYFLTIRTVSAGEVLANRIIWCGFLMVGVVLSLGRGSQLKDAFCSLRLVKTFLVSALFLSGNWLIYIYGVTHGQALETSLGYFINPLLNVAMGMLFFGERLRLGQKIALALAGFAVLILIALGGRFPMIALSLALSFGIYGLIRKSTHADPVIGLTMETLLLLPMAVCWLIFQFQHDQLAMPQLSSLPLTMLLLSGIVTAVPLLFFGQAARLLPLSILGFIQYLAPTLQFLLAVFVFGEKVSPERWWSFGLIWLALAIVSFESIFGLTKPDIDPEIAPID